ncbi:hypothetical protein OF83DRAFT_1035695, partial [Amylostereum chailletii]
LGWLPKGYRPTYVDYGVYVAHRDEFLLSGRGVAAILEGGLVGRIARDVISPEQVLLGLPD